MLKIKRQMFLLLAISGIGSFQIAGASWVALLASRGYTPLEIGIAESIFHIASLLFEIPSGVIADVFGRKRSMILSQCMTILSSIFMIFSKSLPGVCFCMILTAFSYNFASGSREALAYDSMKTAGCEGHYLEFSSVEMSIYRIGNSAALLLAGFSLMIGYQRAYLTDIVTGLACLIFSCALKEAAPTEIPPEKTITERILRCFNDSFLFLFHHKTAIRLMLWNGLIGAVGILTEFFLQTRLPAAGLSGALLGPVLFAVSLGGALGARVAVKTAHWSYRNVSVLCAAGVFLGMCYGRGTLPLIMCIGGFLGNLCDDLLEIHTGALLNDAFPSSQRATLISVSSLCFSIIMIILSPAAGWFFGS